MDAPHMSDAPACVCVVDDDAAVRHAMCNLLEADGYRVLLFDSGESLLALPDLGAIDVAVFDVKLRGMNGFDLLERFRARAGMEGRAIPVLLFSGHSDRSMALRAADAGALDLLRKPVDPDLLFERIAQALRQRQGAPRA